MSAADFEESARLGGDYFTVTAAERFNQSTQLLACTVTCTHGQADVHVHFARNGNGIPLLSSLNLETCGRLRLALNQAT